MSNITDYTKHTSAQLKKLVSMRKIPERSLITRKDQMISALKKYDENPNDLFGLKKYMKTLLGLDKLQQPSNLSQTQTNSETQHFLTLSSFVPSQDLFSNFGDDDRSMMSDMSDLSMLPDVVPTDIQYPNLKKSGSVLVSSQEIVRLEMSRNEYDVLVKLVDDYEKMINKKQVYDQNAKNKRIQQRNFMFVQEGKGDKVKSLVELKPFVKQITLDKFIVK
jgi:hypothetical protein